MGPGQPQGDYTELSQLAARISRFLMKHPDDAEARADMKYVTSLMQGPQGATRAANVAEQPVPENTKMQVASGLMQAGLDIPRSVIGGVLHPVSTLGQLTGYGNMEAWKAARQDPDLSFPEKAEAFVKATPFNAGYTLGRGFLQSLGYKTDEPPAPLAEQVRRGGNIVSSLLLTRYGAPGAGKLISRAVRPIARLFPAQAATATAPVQGLLTAGEDIGTSAQKVPVPGARPPHLDVPLPEPPSELLPSGQSVAEIRAYLTKTKYGTPAQIEEAINRLRRAAPPVAPAPAAPPPFVPTPVPGSPYELLGPEGVSPPAGPEPPSFWRQVYGPPVRDAIEASRAEANPLAQTAAEATATTASKALKALQRIAARKAFNAAMAAGQTHEEASIAARWAATHVRLP